MTAVKLLDPLPPRIRWKLRVHHGIDAVGIWLCAHRMPEVAIWWWKAWRQW